MSPKGTTGRPPRTPDDDDRLRLPALSPVRPTSIYDAEHDELHLHPLCAALAPSTTATGVDPVSTRAFLDRLYSTCSGGVVELRSLPVRRTRVDDTRPVERARHVRHDAGTRRPECRARHRDAPRHDERHRREPARTAGALCAIWTSRPTRPAGASSSCRSARPGSSAAAPTFTPTGSRRSRPTSSNAPSAPARSPSSAGSRSTSTATSRRPTSPACCDCRAPSTSNTPTRAP